MESILTLNMYSSRILGSSSRNSTSSILTSPESTKSMQSQMSASSLASVPHSFSWRNSQNCSLVTVAAPWEAAWNKATGEPNVCWIHCLKRPISWPFAGYTSSIVRYLLSASTEKSACVSPEKRMRPAARQKV